MNLKPCLSRHRAARCPMDETCCRQDAWSLWVSWPPPAHLFERHRASGRPGCQLFRQHWCRIDFHPDDRCSQIKKLTQGKTGTLSYYKYFGMKVHQVSDRQEFELP